MARPRNVSNIQIPPRVNAFTPIGSYRHKAEVVHLNVEEFEVIRLLDYEGLTQVEAAELMQVSRPTLTRIYERARFKVATSLTEARELKIEGGTGVYSSNWFICNDCACRFNNPRNVPLNTCVLCNSAHIHLIHEEVVS